MKITRLIDWLKLAPMVMAAALLAGCDTGGDAVAPVDEPIGAETSTVEPAPAEAEAAPAEAEPAPAEVEPAPAEVEPATP